MGYVILTMLVWGIIGAVIDYRAWNREGMRKHSHVVIRVQHIIGC